MTSYTLTSGACKMDAKAIAKAVYEILDKDVFHCLVLEMAIYSTEADAEAVPETQAETQAEVVPVPEVSQSSGGKSRRKLDGDRFAKLLTAVQALDGVDASALEAKKTKAELERLKLDLAQLSSVLAALEDGEVQSAPTKVTNKAKAATAIWDLVSVNV